MAIQYESDIELNGSTDFNGPVLVNGSAGILGQVLTSQGPNQPAAWAPGFGVDPVISGMIF